MIAKHDIEKAQREAASAEEAQAYIEQVISDNIELTERNKQLTSEVQSLEGDKAKLINRVLVLERSNGSYLI